MERDRKDLSVDDFMTGLISTLALRHHDVVSLRERDFFRRVEESFRVVTEDASRVGVEVRFWITLDDFHKDSPVVREAISAAVLRDLVSLDNPEYQDMRIKLTPREAELQLETVPG